ncbi:NADH:flavin oxidoreductase [Streptomyces sp. NA04227]|uniref:NADH:flavin oxidoreductase n=1 Tax=Streptomyces sp. NA04227 TaxID=2742136 RepID=UPI001591E2EF|nr:NADH:flavin oxidoreductase [Streptomyces sp. NA04227]QKW06863.1 NADH:flavin oxidoreductase [Streptomyces sp. NA04227]
MSNRMRAAEILDRPLTLNSLTVRNRIAMAPMTRKFSPGGVPGEDVARYYARRAAAGVGLIVTEGTYVGHDAAGTSNSVPRFHGADALAGWERTVEAVHAEGGAIFPQLWHVGTARKAGAGPVAEAPSMGPSGIALDEEHSATAYTMTLADIDAVIAAFAESAAAAKAHGFDGIEIHGAHGYLLDQFLWARTNRRTDAYGGDAVARTRFVAEIVAAARAAVGPEFPIALRLSQWKQSDYQARLAETPEELDALLAPLTAAGVDVYHASTRRYWTPEFEGSDLNLAGWTKKLTGLPVISVGSVGLDSEFLESFAGQGGAVTKVDGLLDMLEREEFDMVAIGRALLADPEWARKLLEGRTDEHRAFEAEALQTLH